MAGSTKITTNNSGQTVYQAPPIPYTYKTNASGGGFSSSQTVNLVSVFNPTTKTTGIYTQTYNVLGQPNELSSNNLVAVAGSDGRYEPTSNASNDLAYLLANDKTLTSNLDKQTRFGITDAVEQIEGTKPSTAKVDSTFGRDPGKASSPNDPANAGADPAANPTGGSVNNDQPISLTGVSDINVKAQSGAQLSKNSYRYPEAEISDNKSDYIKFTVLEYGNKGFDKGNVFSPGSRSNTSLGKSVILPIQPSITDNNGARWNEGTLSPLQIAGANISLGTITGGRRGLDEALTTALRSVTDGSTANSLRSLVALYASEQAIQAQLGSRLVGAVLNPNLELLFESPTLRPFTFNFKLSPRNATEAQTVKAIIRFFKLNMAPKTTEGNLFLKTPNVFEIGYIYGPTGGVHKGINRIKSPCALQSFSVDYTPDGSYMTFNEDSGSPTMSMVSYNLSLQFMELEPVYSKDYDQTGQDEIGF